MRRMLIAVTGWMIFLVMVRVLYRILSLLPLIGGWVPAAQA
jgi:hypothetical protein